TERRLAQRLRETWKQAFGRRFVVPDVRAVSETTTAVIVAALEPVERAVRDAERGRHYQRGQIRHRPFAHFIRKRRIAHRLGEPPRARFQLLQMRSEILSGLPGIFETRGVVIADYRPFIAFRRGPSAALRRAVPKMPCEDERNIRVGARSEIPLYAQRSDGIANRSLRPKFSIGGKIVPKQQWTNVPSRTAAPAAEVRDARWRRVQRRQRKRTGKRIGGGEKRVAHNQSLDAIAFAVDVRPSLFAHRIIDGKRDGGFRGSAAGIRDSIPQHGHGQSGLFGIE